MPIMSASVSWLTLAMTGSRFPSLPKFANKSKARASRFSLELNSWSTKSSSTPIVRAKRCAVNSSEKSASSREHPHHGALVQSGNYGIFHGPSGRNAPRPSGQAALADKIAGLEERDDCFLTLRRHNRDFDPAFSNVEDAIRGVALAEDDLTLIVLRDGDPAIRLGEKFLRVEF